ncbi:MAG: bifunctional fucokinase/L-fucose-1-P-guanylyltransferase [Tannerellaceae bacterium]|nr:bifunctional fucokinase/L-fucose-1-P-guanylyltransferase [Tannerellaceae bacterium]
MGRYVENMKKLLSLPPNLVSYFHEIEQVPADEWFCTSDPVGKRLGSGGGTAWLLEACRREEDPESDWRKWLVKQKRILLHAGGQSRRLPAYAPSGKILTPIPVFRWARGQKLKQNLLSLQLPLYEKIMEKAPDSFHTLIVSGDVYIRTNEPLQPVPEADIVCYGLWVDPALATRHGVFVSSRQHPEQLEYMLQKPSLEKLGEITRTHLYLMDIGIWLLNDRAVELLVKRSSEPGKEELKEYDLYGEFGLALGKAPAISDKELNSLTVAILPLPGGEFYHYGTSPELISSTLAIQNLVRDQRAIMQRKVKPHPAMFIQNAVVHISLSPENSDLWIENSYIGEKWRLKNQHILTGIPENNWQIDLPAGICVDMVPVGEKMWAIRPYGFKDPFKGKVQSKGTLFMGKSFMVWATERGLIFPEDTDIQLLPLFPVTGSIREAESLVKWMVTDPAASEGKRLWETAERLSAEKLADQANLIRLTRQRESFRATNWPLLAANHEKSVFYQLDLAHAAEEFLQANLPFPASLSEDTPVMKKIHDHMFRARILKLSGKEFRKEQEQAFSLLRAGLIQSMPEKKQHPVLDIYQDQIVWARSPVRIDLAGGWTDTPPYCMYAGGNVVNVAIELNGQPPLQVYIKPCKDYKIILRSIDLGAMDVVCTWEELVDYTQVGSPFSIPKAALALAGFHPDFSLEMYNSLESQLKAFGSGIEITLLAAIPAGSGLGTSSILAATVLGGLSDFCGLAWDKNEICNRTLILEQLLTTGGGWQDQYGGILHGLKLLQTHDGFDQNPTVRWLPEYLFTDPAYQSCHLLYYTGITRTAKDILAEIVSGMFLNSGEHLHLLEEMKEHALHLYEVIQQGNFDAYGQAIGKTWEQNKALDSGTNPAAIKQIISRIKEYALGYKLPGAGGGGYLYIIAKDPEAALKTRTLLHPNTSCPNARFVDMKLSTRGLQISRS